MEWQYRDYGVNLFNELTRHVYENFSIGTINCTINSSMIGSDLKKQSDNSGSNFSISEKFQNILSERSSLNSNKTL